MQQKDKKNDILASKSAKPFIKWVGGKGQLIEEIKAIFIQNGYQNKTKYAEPMIGGGAVFFEVANAFQFTEFYISDINPFLINAYKVIQTNVSDLIDCLKEMSTRYLKLDYKGRTDFYYATRDSFNSASCTNSQNVKAAAEFIFLNRTCFNGLYRVNKNGKFNVPMGRYKNPLICDSKNLTNVSQTLEKAIIVCADYSETRSFIDKNTLVYFDPPYRPISKTACFTSYNASNFEDNEQKRLFSFVEDISKSGAKVVLSNSDPKNTDENDNFFDDLYKGYNIKRVKATRMINSKSDKRGSVSELLVWN